jgi:hypothetical protein
MNQIIFLLYLIAGCLIFGGIFQTAKPSTWGIGYLVDQYFECRRKAMVERWLQINLKPSAPPPVVKADTTPGVPFTELHNLDNGNLVRRHDAAEVLAEQRQRAHSEKYWLL